MASDLPVELSPRVETADNSGPATDAGITDCTNAELPACLQSHGRAVLDDEYKARQFQLRDQRQREMAEQKKNRKHR